MIGNGSGVRFWDSSVNIAFFYAMLRKVGVHASTSNETPGSRPNKGEKKKSPSGRREGEKQTRVGRERGTTVYLLHHKNSRACQHIFFFGKWGAENAQHQATEHLAPQYSTLELRYYELAKSAGSN